MSFPTASVLDNFNRADGAIGANWSNNPFGPSAGAPSPFTVASNQARVAGGYSEMWYNAASFPNTGGIEVFGTVSGVLPPKAASGTFSGYYLGLVQQPASGVNTGDGYQIGLRRVTGGDTLTLWRYDNTTPTAVIAETPLASDLVLGDVFGFKVATDGTITVYRNGVAIATATDTTYFHAGESAYGEMSITDTNGTATFDDFGAGASVSPSVNRTGAVVIGP